VSMRFNKTAEEVAHMKRKDIIKSYAYVIYEHDSRENNGPV